MLDTGLKNTGRGSIYLWSQCWDPWVPWPASPAQLGRPRPVTAAVSKTKVDGTWGMTSEVVLPPPHVHVHRVKGGREITSLCTLLILKLNTTSLSYKNTWPEFSQEGPNVFTSLCFLLRNDVIRFYATWGLIIASCPLWTNPTERSLCLWL